MELRMHEEALKRYECLLGIFRFSDYIQTQIATALYSLRELDEAEAIFENLLKADPHRVESMDIYSNLLYAKESFSALSFLAHRVFLSDKYRPESCCIIANYYSLKGQHEKSVLYLRRALKLNRKYLSAWTLIGHEYVEMKNTPAVIDAYRRVVEITIAAASGRARAHTCRDGLHEKIELACLHLYVVSKRTHTDMLVVRELIHLV